MRISSCKFATCPCVIHAPNQTWDVWKKIHKMFFNYSHKNLATSDDLTIITWNNLNKGCFEKSMDLQGVSYQVLGSDIKEWNNYLKFDFNVEIADNCKTEFLMGCDSHDVIMLGSPKEIVSKFKTFNCDLLFNSEKFFYPNYDEKILQRWKRFEVSVAQTELCFLNSGAWIGKTDFCKKFFSECQKIRVHDLFDCEPYPALRKSYIGCDQSSVHHVWPQFYPRVQLDYKCEIFINVANLPPKDVCFYPRLL